MDTPTLVMEWDWLAFPLWHDHAANAGDIRLSGPLDDALLAWSADGSARFPRDDSVGNVTATWLSQWHERGHELSVAVQADLAGAFVVEFRPTQP